MKPPLAWSVYSERRNVLRSATRTITSATRLTHVTLPGSHRVPDWLMLHTCLSAQIWVVGPRLEKNPPIGCPSQDNDFNLFKIDLKKTCCYSARSCVIYKMNQDLRFLQHAGSLRWSELATKTVTAKKHMSPAPISNHGDFLPCDLNNCQPKSWTRGLARHTIRWWAESLAFTRSIVQYHFPNNSGN